MSLISKDEPLSTSMIHIGYLVLKEFEKSDQKKISLTDLMSRLKKKDVTHYRPIMFGLMFLHCTGAIEFRSPYLYKK